MNHYDRYTHSCKKIVAFKRIVDEFKKEWGKEDLTLDELYDVYMAVDENLPLDVHLSMFIPLMKYHTSAEQRGRWLDDAVNFRIIGAYAQTELAHGSNVRGIQTTAIYDERTESFDLHSPTISALKWWPGGLGHTCTHAVVYANLFIPGGAGGSMEKKGVHAFMVRLRAAADHIPMPGVECGDIGPKLGYNSMDNGYARFTHVQVPREDMLNGFAQVASDGSYTKQNGAEKVAYGIMLDVRVRIVVNSAYVLARALTIGVRYSTVRVQGGFPRERSVMEYPSQQRILLPLLALAIGLHFTGHTMRAKYSQYTSSAYSGDLSAVESQLPELHMQSAGLKALTTTLVSDGMEACRKACGGHGFLSNSGFGDLLTSYLPMCTLEGTREVLGQQSGRSLLKMRFTGLSIEVEGDMNSCRGKDSGILSTFWNGMTSPSLSALLDEVGTLETPKSTLLSDSTLKGFTRLLYIRASYLVNLAKNSVVSHGGASANKEIQSKAMLLAGHELVVASEAYSEYLIAHAFMNGLVKLRLEESKIGLPTQLTLQRLFQLYVLWTSEKSTGQCYSCGILRTSSQETALHSSVAILCAQVKPDAVCVVEGWMISNTRLDSTLGRSDGQYQEALYDAARNEPLNTKAWETGGVSEGYTKSLSSILRKSDLLIGKSKL